MQKPAHGPIWRTLQWVLVPLCYPQYRRLIVRSAVLSARLRLLSTLLFVVTPFATPELLLLLRRWFEALRRDVWEFGRVVRMHRPLHAASTVTPAATGAAEFRNPWA